MAELYRKYEGDITFSCYSERGIVAYYMFRVLPKNPLALLHEMETGTGEKLFQSVQVADITNLTIFSELGFGSRWGFGNPDAAIYFDLNHKAVMVFYEAKMNESYQQSCRGRSYNSTIQGQLELKWRLMSLFKEGNIQNINGTEFIVETQDYVKTYADSDKFYKSIIADFRHLSLTGGVRDLFQDYIAKCELARIYYLASTTDKRNPFTDSTTPATLLPRCHHKTWDEARGNFCWMNNDIIKYCDSV